MNFAITPHNFPIEEYIIGTESACKLLGQDTKQAERLGSDIVKTIKHANPPKSNITLGERKALQNLAKEKEIMILPADKGRAVVIMDTSDYKSKAKTLLNDVKTYKTLKKDPTTKYSNTLVTKLQELKNEGALDDITYKRLYPTSAVIPKFYGLPKVHKTGAPLRPIVASRGSITYDVARYVADILAPIVGKNGYALKNSSDLVKQLNNCQLDEDDVLVSFDVTALFTCVPVDRSLEIIHQKLNDDTTLNDRTNLSAKQVTDLLEICLRTTYFQFDQVIYAQVEGAAMGSPVSPIVANLFMEWFEETAINSFKYEITLWRRYVDDTLVALSDTLIEDFSTHINNIHPAIKFTREEENNYTIAILDTLIKRSPSGRLSFSVYRKSTHTDQYLQYNSNQPLQHKLGVVRTLSHRCKTICSNEEEIKKETDHIKKVLSISGYTKSAWVTANKPKSPTVPQDPNKTRPKGSITLPYVGNTSDAIARTMRKAGITVHLKPFNTLRSHLVHPKDKVPLEDRAGLVYHIKCGDCSASYVGETERKLQKRIKEHHRTTSPVGHHLNYNKHSINKDSVKVLHQESNWFRRGVAEAIYIEKERPILNRDRGRHTLPVIYREIVNSRDLAWSRDSNVQS